MKRDESVKNTNNNYTNLNLNKSLSTNSEKEIKAKSRQKALTTITDLLKNNKYLMEQGLDYINSLSKKVEEDLAKAIYPVGFYKNKAKNIKLCAKQVLENFNGIVPDNMDDLQSLAGVRKKICKCCYVRSF